jgi:chromosome segregation ATPase
MELIADGLLIATAMTTGLYCLVLSRRLARLTESGNGIGPQINALDQALSETRAALTETREGMSELRNSAKTTIAQLNHETERGEEMAQRIERGIGEAKATMQRIYEVNDRIEAHENAPVKVDHVDDDHRADDAGERAGEAEPDVETPADTGNIPPIDWADKEASATIDAADAESTTRQKIVLPEGTIDPGVASPAAARANASAQAGSVLKAERVLL